MTNKIFKMLDDGVGRVLFVFTVMFLSAGILHFFGQSETGKANISAFFPVTCTNGNAYLNGKTA